MTKQPFCYRFRHRHHLRLSRRHCCNRCRRNRHHRRWRGTAEGDYCIVIPIVEQMNQLI